MLLDYLGYGATVKTRVFDGGTHSRSRSSNSSVRQSHARVRYARIRLVDRGVRPRTPTATSPTGTKETKETKKTREDPIPSPIPFNLILEPLYFGVLPASLVPTVLGLCVLLVTSSAFFLKRVYVYLCAVAACARDELSKVD